MPSIKPGGAREPKACLPCAKVKAKCELEPGHGTCKRCRRLQKTCSGQAPGAHRRAFKTPSLAIGEQGLDDAAFLLPASLPIYPVADPSPTHDTTDLTAATWVDRFVKNENEGDLMLENFQTEVNPLFPFVVIPSGIVFKDLKEKKPYLILSILMVACRNDQARRRMIAQKIREIISYNILVKGEQSLDILQGLLVYVNWYHLHLHLGSQLCNLVHLIMSMVIELGLNKEITTKSGFGKFGYFGKAGRIPITTPSQEEAPLRSSSAKTLEEYRTFLGCFFLTSIVSMCKRDIEPIRHSKYVDHCCRRLSEAVQFPTDMLVVHLAQLHSLAGKISNTLTRDDSQMLLALNSVPVGACVKPLESELKSLRESFPEEARQNITLHLHYSIMEVFLFETALNEDIDSARYQMHSFTSLNMIYACFHSTKLWFETLHAIPTSKILDLPYPIWELLGHAVAVLSRLSLFRANGWDHEHVRGVFDFSSCMDRLSQKLDEAKVLATKSGSNTVIHNSLPQDASRLFLRIKAAHEAQLEAQTNTSSERPDLSSAEIAMGSWNEHEENAFFEFLNDSFWQY